MSKNNDENLAIYPIYSISLSKEELFFNNLLGRIDLFRMTGKDDVDMYKILNIEYIMNMYWNRRGIYYDAVIFFNSCVWSILFCL